MILVIVDLDRWRREGRAPPPVEGFRFAAFADLDAALLAEVDPEVVLSPLHEGGADAVDLAQRLHALGFQGRLRALAPALPCPEVVVAEVAAAAPGLDFDLFVLSARAH